MDGTSKTISRVRLQGLFASINVTVFEDPPARSRKAVSRAGGHAEVRLCITSNLSWLTSLAAATSTDMTMLFTGSDYCLPGKRHRTTQTCSELAQGPLAWRWLHRADTRPEVRCWRRKQTKNPITELCRKSGKAGLYHCFPFPFLTPKPSLLLNSVMLYASWSHTCQSKQPLRPLAGTTQSLQLLCRKCMFMPYRNHIIYYNHGAKWYKLGNLKDTFGNLPLSCSNYFLISQFKGSILAPILNCLAFISLCHRIHVKQFSDSLLKTADCVLPDKAECLH